MRLLPALLALVLWTACSPPHKAPEMAAVSVMAAEDEATPSPSRPLDTRKLIRTVALYLRVDDTEAVAEKVQALAEEAGGYVASVNASRRQDLLHYQITLKVPAEKLDAIVDQVKALAIEVERENLTTEDVTDRYVDLEARLRTLAATETELQGLLAESRSRGHKAEDIMAIYEQLLEIRTRSEQLQAQLNTLANQTTYSTIHLTLTPTEAARPLVGDRWRPSETVRGSFRTLLAALRGLTDFAIFFVVVLLPVSLVVAVPLWLLVKLWRRLRRKKPRPEDPASA